MSRLSNPLRCILATLLVITLYVGSAYAQPIQDVEASLRWGDRQKAPSSSELAKVIQAGSWGAYLMRYKAGRGFSKEKYWIEHYNAQMNMVARFEFQLPGDGSGDLEDIISLKGQMYLLYSRPNPADQAVQVLLRPFSPRGQVTGQEQLLADLPEGEKYRRRQFDLEFSRDSSFILLYNQVPPEDDGQERFTLRVLDEDMNLYWSRDVKLTHADRGFSIRSYQVDQEGNVFLLGRKASTRSDSEERPVFYVYAYTRGGRQETVYELDIPEVQLNKLLLRIAGNGDLVCAGLYGVPAQEANIGVCHIRINPLTKEAYKVDFLPFTTEFLTETQGADRGQRVASTRFFQLRDLTLRSDGGCVLVAEEYYRTQSNGPQRGPGLPMNTLFYYNDIMVANVAPDGTYTWLRRIPKEQVTANDNGRHSSFAQATVQDRFFFLYNDHPDSYRPRGDRQRTFEDQNSVISISEITRAGELSTVPLFFNVDAGIRARPRRCVQISARQMLIYGEQERIYRLGLLTF